MTLTLVTLGQTEPKESIRDSFGSVWPCSAWLGMGDDGLNPLSQIQNTDPK
jgi:hypothetical protein